MSDVPDIRLTPRELEVLEMVSRGLSNAEIAAASFVELTTIEKQLNSLYKKLATKSRAALVGKGFRGGWLS